MKLTKKSKIVIYIILCLLFLFLLFSANHLISEIVFGGSLKKVDLKNHLCPESVEFGIGENDIVLTSTFNGNVSAKGWAFCEGNKTNDNKEITLLFHSSKETYAVEFITTNPKQRIQRPDLNSAFDEGSIPIKNNGFEGEFSVIIMKNGTYELYIYCKENTESCGITKTNMIFVKENADFFQLNNEK